MLMIPDVRQTTDYDCGAAAVDAVAEFHGQRRRSLSGIKHIANPVQGMAPETVEAVLRSIGLTVLSGVMTVADLRHLTRTGRPVLCPVATGGGHWVVVRGVTRCRVHYHCPTHGPSSLPILSWESQWHGETRHGHGFERWGICPHK